VPLILITVG